MADNDVEVSETSNSVFSADELYKFGLYFYKNNEGNSLQLTYQQKLELIALTQQSKQGSLKQANLPPLGTLDIIGKERRAAWEKLGDLGKEEAKEKFVSLLYELAPSFKVFVSEKEEEEIVKTRLEKEKLEEEEKSKIRQEERVKEELQRRAIQDALNKQTFGQFRSYAEQQYPGNPDEQAQLIKQLQEQHYHQYMQRLYQQQAAGGQLTDNNIEMNTVVNENVNNEAVEEETSLVETVLENGVNGLHLGDNIVENGDIPNGEILQEFVEPEEAKMWTKKEVDEFKETIKKDEGEAIIKIGHGETVTVRVPTHVDGKSLYWEFATDSYDIGFGLFFEWVDPEDTQVTVHISDSEDDDEEYVSDEDNPDNENGDAESGGRGLLVDNGPPTSCIIPIYRRDCHEEVYAGSHAYPRQGVYQLKFDNSYSLWRSKTLYYRVYYTR